MKNYSKDLVSWAKDVLEGEVMKVWWVSDKWDKDYIYRDKVFKTREMARCFLSEINRIHPGTCVVRCGSLRRDK